MVAIRKHSKVSGIYFVNGKTVVVDRNGFISNIKLNEMEEKIFKIYLKVNNQ